MRETRATLFTLYSAALGVGSALLLGAWLLASVPLPSRLVTEAAILAAAAAISWGLSFRLHAGAWFSLDLSCLMTALLLFPSPLPMAVGAGAALAGTLVRHERFRSALGASAVRVDLTTIALNTGTVSLAMAGGQWLLHEVGRGEQTVGTIGWSLFWRLTSIFVLLATANAALMTIGAVLRGESPRAYLGRHARQGLPLEAINHPVAGLMVITRTHAGLEALLVLVGCMLMAAFLLRRHMLTQEKLARAYEQLEARATELEALDRIGREITSSLDLRRVLETIHQQVTRFVDAPHFSVALHDPERHEIKFEYLVGSSGCQEGSSRALGRDPVSRAIITGRPILLWDTQQARASALELPAEPSELERQLRSILVIPLTQPSGDVLGVLTLGSPRSGVYSPDHLRVLTSIALHAAIAIQNARYYEMATVDAGTRLYIKAYFMRRLEEEMGRSRRYGHPVSLFMMDLDGFKQINDAHGHLAGDRLLSEVGQVIRANLRSHDIASRYGGEEFAALLPETHHAEAVVIAERIRRHVGAIRLREEGRRFGTTISIGIACSARGARRKAEDLIRKADEALYQAKREGKDKVISAA